MMMLRGVLNFFETEVTFLYRIKFRAKILCSYFKLPFTLYIILYYIILLNITLNGSCNSLFFQFRCLVILK